VGQDLIHAGSSPSLCHAVELRNIEGASGDAITAADTILLLEIDHAIRILHDGAIRRARFEASGFRAVHALMFAHQPLQRTVFSLVFVKENEVPIIPARVWHRLIGVIKRGLRKRQVVPFYACHLAGLAANTCRRVHQFADLILPLRVFASHRSCVATDLLNA